MHHEPPLFSNSLIYLKGDCHKSSGLSLAGVTTDMLINPQKGVVHYNLIFLGINMCIKVYRLLKCNISMNDT